MNNSLPYPTVYRYHVKNREQLYRKCIGEDFITESTQGNVLSIEVRFLFPN